MEEDKLASSTRDPRQHAYGQKRVPTLVDRFGTSLSNRRVRKHVRDFTGRQIGDFGCGFNATFVRSVLDKVERAVLVDLALAPDLKSNPKVLAIEGPMPEALASVESDSLDVVLCLSVLEHLWDPLTALKEFRRITVPDGLCLLNVPTWRGKWFLEFSAFKLGLSPPEEMDDHKTYYDPRDLWPLLVQAGFIPHNIRCFTHKFGLNTFAICQMD